MRISFITKVCLRTAAILILTLNIVAYADNHSVDSQQEQIDQTLEMLKDSGLDANSLKQMEQMFKGMQVEGAKQDAAKLELEKEEALSTHSRKGTAQVETPRQSHDLLVSQCWIDEEFFNITATHIPGSQEGKLYIVRLDPTGVGKPTSLYVQFSDETDTYTSVTPPAFETGENTISWQGKLASNAGSTMELKFLVELRADCLNNS